MKKFIGFATLEIADSDGDSRRLEWAECRLVMNVDGKARVFLFRGGNGGAYGVDVTWEDEELPSVTRQVKLVRDPSDET